MARSNLVLGLRPLVSLLAGLTFAGAFFLLIPFVTTAVAIRLLTPWGLCSIPLFITACLACLHLASKGCLPSFRARVKGSARTGEFEAVQDVQPK